MVIPLWVTLCYAFIPIRNITSVVKDGKVREMDGKENWAKLVLIPKYYDRSLSSVLPRFLPYSFSFNFP